MAGRHSFAELRAGMLADKRARIAAKFEALRAEMALAEVRRALDKAPEEER